MSSFSTILATLIPIFGIMVLGAFAERLQALPDNAARSLNQFVFKFSLPLLVFDQLARVRPEQIPPGAVWGVLLGLLLIQAAATFYALRVQRESLKDSVMTGLLSSFPNGAFMGIPVILLLYPVDTGAALTAGLFIVLAPANLVVSDALLSVDASHGQGRWHVIWRAVSSLGRNPIILSAVLGTVVSVFALSVPGEALIISRMIGSTAAPCALFCMGMGLSAQIRSLRARAGASPDASSGIASLGRARLQITVIVFKLCISPVLVFVLAWIFGARGAPLVTATVMAAMPSGVLAYVLAEKYEAAKEDASLAIVVTTLLSALTVAVVIAVAQWAAH